MNEPVLVTDAGADLEGVARVAEGAPFELSPSAVRALERGRNAIEALLGSGRAIYGVNTGFGRLATTVVEGEALAGLQRNLLLSHSCGTGPLLSREQVRLMVFLRVASLARGRSGIRPCVVENLVKLANGPVYPAVPSRGSLGASGDLAPLSHMCLPLIGEGECVTDSGELVPGTEALELLGMEPLALAAKEGLSLINGTQFMTALLSLALIEARALMNSADAAAALTLEALLGTDAALEHELLSLRPHPGAIESARRIRQLLEGSEILQSHRNCERVQDAYSLRCTPQVHGACRDALSYVESILRLELLSVTDNPLLMEDGRMVSGGNFHGQPLAMAADHLKTVAAVLGNISERRIERLLNPDLSGLPAFLARDPGMNSGLMIAQYTAASLVSENKVLAHPSCVDSIPVSGNQEDHVSMGATAARHCAEIVRNSTHVLATELVCGVQAHRFLERGAMGSGNRETMRAVEMVFEPMDSDRRFVADIEAVAELIRQGCLGQAS
jgi:histidine ammonia-lyase